MQTSVKIQQHKW